jgi:hypothetical protein
VSKKSDIRNDAVRLVGVPGDDRRGIEEVFFKKGVRVVTQGHVHPNKPPAGTEPIVTKHPSRANEHKNP